MTLLRGNLRCISPARLFSPDPASELPAMWLLWPSFALLALRFFEVGWFATLSWWWVALPFAVAFVYFEFIERPFGLDKRRAMNEMDKARAERIRKAFKKDPGRPR
jgi:small Trp-rich protein